MLIGIATFYDNVSNNGQLSKMTNILPALGVSLHSSSRPSHVFMIKQAVPFGSGSITNANNLIGLRDGKFANIRGTAANAGGQIVGTMDRPVRGDIWIYARSVSTNTHLYTYASFNFNTWTQTSVQTVFSSGSAQWIHCGASTNMDVVYLGLAAINDNGNQANIDIDMAIIIPI